MFSADCAEAKTLSQAHIHGLEIRCVMGVSWSISRVFTSISWTLTSQYLLAWTIGVGYTSNLKRYCTLKNNSHWIRVLHYCCLLLAASMTTTIEQLPVKDRLSQPRMLYACEVILEYDAYDVLLKCVLPANIKRLLQVVEWGDVLVYTNDVLQCLHSIAYN